MQFQVMMITIVLLICSTGELFSIAPHSIAMEKIVLNNPETILANSATAEQIGKMTSPREIEALNYRLLDHEAKTKLYKIALSKNTKFATAAQQVIEKAKGKIDWIKREKEVQERAARNRRIKYQNMVDSTVDAAMETDDETDIETDAIESERHPRVAKVVNKAADIVEDVGDAAGDVAADIGEALRSFL